VASLLFVGALLLILVVVLAQQLFRGALREVVRWDRQRFTTGMKVLKVVYWESYDDEASPRGCAAPRTGPSSA